jgi:hypothetical protein
VIRQDFALVAWNQLVVAPSSLVVVVTGLPGRTAVFFALASAVIHVGYELALMNSYRLGR